MPDELERARIVAGQELDPGVASDGIGKVGERAVERHRHRALGERLGDALRDLAAGDARRGTGAARRREMSG